MARRTGTLSIFAALFALVLALWAPAALAHHKDGHTQGGGSTASGSDHDGDADSDSNTAYTEDNDTNDDAANNEADEGDNAHPSGKDRSVENGGSGTQGKSESNPDDSKGPMRYEGELGDDKANGPGGTDLEDQDGNNGCGNDDDFDDDNNGWCGKPVDRVKDTKTPDKPCDADATMPGIQKCDKVGGEIIEKPCDADATMPGVQKCEKPDEVQGEVIVDKPCPLLPIMGDVLGDLCGKDEVEGADLEKNPSTPEDNVLGVRVSAAVAPAAVAPAAVAAAPEAAGAVLPFTGASDLLPLVAVALMLIGIGALALRGRRVNA